MKLFAFKVCYALGALVYVLGPYVLALAASVLQSGKRTLHVPTLLPYLLGLISLAWGLNVQWRGAKDLEPQAKAKREKTLQRWALIWLGFITVNMFVETVSPASAGGFVFPSIIIMMFAFDSSKQFEGASEAEKAKWANWLQGSQSIREHPAPEDQ